MGAQPGDFVFYTAALPFCTLTAGKTSGSGAAPDEMQ
jgi:hypothetical protein